MQLAKRKDDQNFKIKLQSNCQTFKVDITVPTVSLVATAAIATFSLAASSKSSSSTA